MPPLEVTAVLTEPQVQTSASVHNRREAFNPRRSLKSVAHHCAAPLANHRISLGNGINIHHTSSLRGPGPYRHAPASPGGPPRPRNSHRSLIANCPPCSFGFRLSLRIKSPSLSTYFAQ